MNKPVGNITKKNTNAITIGEINLPNNIPNLNQMLFKGVSNLELKIPRTKNKIDNITDQILI
jgi:hypothetical protein